MNCRRGNIDCVGGVAYQLVNRSDDQGVSIPSRLDRGCWLDLHSGSHLRLVNGFIKRDLDRCVGIDIEVLRHW